MHEYEKIRSLPSEENLEKAEETLRNKDWSEMRKFGRENREVSREISNEMNSGSHRELK